VLDKNATLGANPAIKAASGAYASGLVGGINFTTNGKFKVEGVYIDTSTANVESNYRIVTNATSGSWPSETYFEDFALIWNSAASSSGTFLGPMSPGDIAFEVATANILEDGNASSDTFEASTGGCSDWYMSSDTARVLQLGWENPVPGPCD